MAETPSALGAIEATHTVIDLDRVEWIWALKGSKRGLDGIELSLEQNLVTPVPILALRDATAKPVPGVGGVGGF